MNDDVAAIAAALAEPFEASEVHWKPAVVSGNRAMALCYVDARSIMDRLDEVIGLDGWFDAYEVRESGSVVCSLSLRLGKDLSGWITKQDVGSLSEQPDDGDKLKAAFSDALKRAAVKFGIGRYLYRLPRQWVDYDPSRKCFVTTPKLPAEALPKSNGTPQTPQGKMDQAELRRRAHAILEPFCAQGMAAFENAWKNVISRDMRIACKDDLAEMKKAAAEAKGGAA